MLITKAEDTGYPASAGDDSNTRINFRGSVPRPTPLVNKAERRHLRRAIYIAQVDDHRLRQFALQPFKVEGAVLHPFRHHHHGVRAANAGVGIVAIFDIGQFAARLFHADGIVRPHLGAQVEQPGHQRDRRRLAHVVGVGLEGQAEHGDGLAAQAAAGGIGDLARHRALAVVVDRQHRLDDPQRHVVIERDLHQRAGILWKTRAAEAGAGMQEFRADAIVEPDAARDFLHIGADLFGQIRDLVDEGDLGGEKRIGRVFDQLRGAPLGKHQRRLIERQRPVDIAEHLAPALVRSADHDAIRKLEVADRGTLAQEFGIGGHHHVGRRIGFMNQSLDFVAGADRHRRFGDYNGEALKRRCDLARRGMNVAQIGVAVAASRRRADGNEHRIGRRDRCGKIGGKIQPPGLHIGSHQRIEAGLKNRDFAPAQACDLVAILVHAGDLVTEIRETGA